MKARAALRFPALDGLRGVACLMVMAYHEGRRLKGGFLGVDVFFVLSGFLITNILLEEWDETGGVRLGRFYARRVLRLAPALCAFVAVVTFQRAVPVPPSIGPMRGIWAIATVTYVSDLLMAYWHVFPMSLVTHCWSLGIEEQFYLLWPLALITARRRGVRLPWILGAVIAAIVACAALRQAIVTMRPDDPDLLLRVYYAPDTRADVILTGCALALWRALPRPAIPRAWALGLGAAGALVVGYLASTRSIGDMVRSPLLFSAAAVAAAAMVEAGCEPSRWTWILASRPLAWIGRLSYSLYLWHAFAFLAGRRLGLFPFEPTDVALMYLLALAFACASYYVIERPFLRLKDRLRGQP